MSLFDRIFQKSTNLEATILFDGQPPDCRVLAEIIPVEKDAGPPFPSEEARRFEVHRGHFAIHRAPGFYQLTITLLRKQEVDGQSTTAKIVLTPLKETIEIRASEKKKLKLNLHIPPDLAASLANQIRATRGW